MEKMSADQENLIQGSLPPCLPSSSEDEDPFSSLSPPRENSGSLPIPESPQPAQPIRRLADDDVRAIFECLHGQGPQPEHLAFSIVRSGKNGLKLSPPSYEFEVNGLYVLLRPEPKKKRASQENLPKCPPHLEHLLVQESLPETCKWSLSGPQFPKPTAIQQRYCYPKGREEYSSRIGGALWTMYSGNGEEDLEFRLLHVYFSEKRASNKGMQIPKTNSESPAKKPRKDVKKRTPRKSPKCMLTRQLQSPQSSLSPHQTQRLSAARIQLKTPQRKSFSYPHHPHFDSSSVKSPEQPKTDPFGDSSPRIAPTLPTANSLMSHVASPPSLSYAYASPYQQSMSAPFHFEPPSPQAPPLEDSTYLSPPAFWTEPFNRLYPVETRGYSKHYRQTREDHISPVPPPSFASRKRPSDSGSSPTGHSSSGTDGEGYFGGRLSESPDSKSSAGFDFTNPTINDIGHHMEETPLQITNAANFPWEQQQQSNVSALESRLLSVQLDIQQSILRAPTENKRQSLKSVVSAWAQTLALDPLATSFPNRRTEADEERGDFNAKDDAPMKDTELNARE